MLIGLHGQKGSGKDEVYNQAPAFKRKISLAHPVKRCVSLLFNIDLSTLEENKRGSIPHFFVRFPRYSWQDNKWFGWTVQIPGLRTQTRKFTTRQILQRMGTEVGRTIFGENVWIDLSLPHTLQHNGEGVFVTDVRFENEAQRVIDLGGFIVKVDAGLDSSDSHASEEELPTSYISHVLDNSIRSDEYESLRSQIEYIISNSSAFFAGNYVRRPSVVRIENTIRIEESGE